MGQTLSEPITAKQSSSLQNKCVKVGSSSMQGWRISMEDAHTHILTLSEDKDAAFFAVYDGHGGSKIASHVSKNLHKFIVRRQEYKQGNYEDAIVKGFLECDDAMRKDEQLKDDMSGSTAITALYRNKKLFVGNVGDSRCIACSSGLAEPLSSDHKPGNALERDRIEQAGGFVEFNRVNGNLALSRAFGDFAFKNNNEFPAEGQMITSKPDVVVHEVGEDLMFMVLACDGIWDVMSNQEVADFVISKMATGMEPELICEELMTRCLAPDTSMGGLGCDNMTVILVCFLHNQPFDRLVETCIEIEKIREDTRLRRIREDDERNNEDEMDVLKENVINGTDLEDVKESNEINSAATDGESTD